MVPPAANVLAYSVHQMTVWFKPRCKALYPRKQTITNKLRNEHVTFIYRLDRKKTLNFINLSTSVVTPSSHHCLSIYHGV